MQLPCWRAFLQDELKRFTNDPPQEVRFVRKAYRIVFLLTSQNTLSPTKSSSKEEIRSVVVAGRCETMGAACRYVAHLPALIQTLFTR